MLGLLQLRTILVQLQRPLSSLSPLKHWLDGNLVFDNITHKFDIFWHYISFLTRLPINYEFAPFLLIFSQ